MNAKLNKVTLQKGKSMTYLKRKVFLEHTVVELVYKFARSPTVNL